MRENAFFLASILLCGCVSDATNEASMRRFALKIRFDAARDEWSAKLAERSSKIGHDRAP
jgi:hypothetical protein